jgi:hypothetical protein
MGGSTLLALLGLSTLASVVVSIVLGWRLLRLWSRTREVPELAIGASFLFAGVIGYIATIIGNAGTAGLPEDIAYQVMVSGIGLISVGVALVYFFVWKVFHPEARWAQALFWVATATLMLTILPLSGSPSAGAQVSFTTVMGDLVRFGGGAWGAWESLRYFGLMRKRMRVGLAEASVTNRFLLWGIASLAPATIFLATSTAMRLSLSPADGAVTPGVMTVISLLTLATAVSQWLAFLPPQRYTRWIESRAAAAA